MTLQQDNKAIILENEIFYLGNLNDPDTNLYLKVGYCAILHCSEGSVETELADGRRLTVNKGQLLLIPAYKLVRIIPDGSDSQGGILFISDQLLKSLLGHQIGIWNKAMYLNETYLIDGEDWVMELSQYTQSLFRGKHLSLFHEIVLSYMRTLLLIFCDGLIRQGGYEQGARSSDHERELFNQFLTLLTNGSQQRQTVASCASELHITAKYLSTVCKDVSGKSPSKWIMENTMEKCYALLLDSSLSIKEISNQLGFPNSSFFGQYFRKQAGMTPMEYRNLRKGNI